MLIKENALYYSPKDNKLICINSVDEPTKYYPSGCVYYSIVNDPYSETNWGRDEIDCFLKNYKLVAHLTDIK